MTNSNAYGFYPDRSKYNLEDHLALIDHQHDPSGLILPAGAGAGNLIIEDDGQGNLSFNTSDVPYGFVDPGDWDLSDQEVVQIVRDNLMALHMPESDPRAFSSDYATVTYWLKGGFIYWIYSGSPWAPASPTLEVKTLGWFEYDDGTPCPYQHAIQMLFPTMASWEKCTWFLTHPTDSDLSASIGPKIPWSAKLAIHKHNHGGTVQHNLVGSGVFKMTGGRFEEDGSGNWNYIQGSEWANGATS